MPISNPQVTITYILEFLIVLQLATLAILLWLEFRND